VFLCAVLTWNWYALRVSAFILSFSAWFAVQWGVLIARWAPDFLQAPAKAHNAEFLLLLAVVALTFVLFFLCAVVSLWWYVSSQPVEPRSRAAMLLGGALMTAHMLHSLLLLLEAGLAS
jgi:hypothetical protein